MFSSGWSSSRIFIAYIAVIGWCCCVSHATSSENPDLVLNGSELVALDKFKAAVAKQLPHDYMKEDVYLIKWLRAKNFNITDAMTMLNEHVKWRAENRMDTILAEDWSDMEASFPYSLDSRDKDGRPIYIPKFGEWDLRKAESSGQFPRLVRYTWKVLEEQADLIRRLQEKGENVWLKKVTRIVNLYDMDGFSVARYSCKPCGSYFPQFFAVALKNFPSQIETLYMINVPPPFQVMLRSFSRNTPEPMRNRVKVFGNNMNEYLPELLKTIDKDQLPEKFGGSKITTPGL